MSLFPGGLPYCVLTIAPEYRGRSGASRDSKEEVEERKAASSGAACPSAPSVAVMVVTEPKSFFWGEKGKDEEEEWGGKWRSGAA